jgi:hypothetical protein
MLVIALTRAVRRNGGRWVKGEPLVELQRELEERWPRITGVGPAYKGDASRWTRGVDLSCGHTLQSQDVRLKKGRAFYCALCNPELLGICRDYERSSAHR